MAAKLMITRWQGPGGWTQGQKDAYVAQGAQLISCSVAWTQKPVPGITTIIGVQAGMELFNGGVAGSAGEAKYDIATGAIALGYDLFPLIRSSDGQVENARIRTYAATPPGHVGTETFALNMTRGVVCRWLAAQLVSHFAWADGLHVDYWTPASGWVPGDLSGGVFVNAGYTGVSGGASFDTAYMLGMNRFVHEFRRLRTLQGKSSFVIGQQWHNNSEVRELDGRYVEQDPDKWGTDPWQTYHQAQFDAFPSLATAHGGLKSNMVIEDAVRAAGPFLNKPYPDSAYQSAIMAFANTNNCFVSFGREDQAGIGWPG